MNEDTWVIISAHFWPKFEFNISVSVMLQIVSYSHSDSSNNDNKAKYSVKEPALNGMRFPMCNFCSLWLIVYTVSHNIFSETILSTVNKVNIFITIDIPQHLRGQSLTHPSSPQAWYGALSLIQCTCECITIHTCGQRPFPPTTTPPYLIVHFMCIVGSGNNYKVYCYCS